MRAAGLLFIVALIAGCTAVPEQPLQAFGDAYAEMKVAAETVYANYSSDDVTRRKTAFETKLAAATPGEYFDLIVPKTLAEPLDRGQSPPAIATNARAALEAGAVYNAALVALASGKSVEEVQQGVAALSGTIGTLGGVPWLGPVIGIVVSEVEKARARGELVATLTREYTITLPDGETRTGHLMDLLLDLLIEHADLMFEKRREIALQRAEAFEFEERNPGAAKIVADGMADDYTVLAQYRQLLVETKQYFRQLQDAAANPPSDVQAAATAQIAGEIVAQSRLVVALISGTP